MSLALPSSGLVPPKRFSSSESSKNVAAFFGVSSFINIALDGAGTSFTVSVEGIILAPGNRTSVP